MVLQNEEEEPVDLESKLTEDLNKSLIEPKLVEDA